MFALKTPSQPIRVGPIALPNRIAATSYSISSRCANGLPDDPLIEHHKQRASGGARWIGGENHGARVSRLL